MSGLDMNRVFPGSTSGAVAENIAAKLVEDIKGADVCVDIHASNIFIREIPQVRIPSAESSHLLKYAKMLNTDFVWVHDSNAVGEGSLAAALREVGVPTLVIEMGVGQRITKEYCKQLLSGIFNLMSKLGIWVGPTENVSHPMVSSDGAVHVIHSGESGIFIPKVEHNMWAYLLAEGISHRLRGQRDCKNSQHELIYYIPCFAEMYIRTVYSLNLTSVI